MKIIKYKKLKDNLYQIITSVGEFKLYDMTIINFNLLNKKQVDDKELENIIAFNANLECYFKALKYLSIKMRSKKEIEDYLIKQDFKLSNIKNSLKRLESEGYINEEKYAKSFINDQLTLTLNGKNKIKRELINKGVSEEDFNNYLEEIEYIIWEEKIKKIISKRSKGNKDSKKTFQIKLSKYLQNLGYTSDQYNNLLNDISVNDNTNLMREADKLYLKLKKKYDEENIYYILTNKLIAKGYSIEDIKTYLEENKK